jgi:UDP-N-acetyl-D-mannosaminuronic acid dehydrogenase
MPKPKKLVIIGGCGHVSLPLGIVFANRGINVVPLDISAERIAAVNSGRMPFMEKSADVLPQSSPGFHAVPDLAQAVQKGQVRYGTDCAGGDLAMSFARAAQPMMQRTPSRSTIVPW